MNANGVSQFGSVRGGEHYLSQNDRRLHFGLSHESKMNRIEIRWPGGRMETLKNLAADFICTMTEGNCVQNVIDSPATGSALTPSAKLQ